MANIFISYSFNDSEIAHGFKRALDDTGPHEIFLAEDRESIPIGVEWSKKITSSIKSCEYFLILLSKSSIHSEFVVEEINYAIDLKSNSEQDLPYILPIWINLSFDTELDYNLAARIKKYQARAWSSENDTHTIVEEIKTLFKDGPRLNAIDPDLSEINILQDGKIPVAKVGITDQKGNDDYYVIRSSDERIFEKLDHSDSIIKIKGPSQYGKGHLMKRLVEKAKVKDFKVIVMDFNSWGGSDYKNEDVFFQKFCRVAFRRLTKERIGERLTEFWNSLNTSAKDKASEFFLEFILQNPEMVLLAINDIDKIFDYPDISGELCSLLRFWYNESAIEEYGFEKIKLAMSYSSDTVNAIASVNESPFNVGGDAVTLPPFTREETADMCLRYEPSASDDVVEFIFSNFGGHPYLTKNALAKLYVDQISIDEFKEKLIAADSPFRDHLRKISHRVSINNLSDAIHRIHSKTKLLTDDFFKLSALGIIKGNLNEIEWSNGLYESFFKTNF